MALSSLPQFAKDQLSVFHLKKITDEGYEFNQGFSTDTYGIVYNEAIKDYLKRFDFHSQNLIQKYLKGRK